MSQNVSLRSPQTVLASHSVRQTESLAITDSVTLTVSDNNENTGRVARSKHSCAWMNVTDLWKGCQIMFNSHMKEQLNKNEALWDFDFHRCQITFNAREGTVQQRWKRSVCSGFCASLVPDGIHRTALGEENSSCTYMTLSDADWFTQPEQSISSKLLHVVMHNGTLFFNNT